MILLRTAGCQRKQKEQGQNHRSVSHVLSSSLRTGFLPIPYLNPVYHIRELYPTCISVPEQKNIPARILPCGDVLIHTIRSNTATTA